MEKNISQYKAELDKCTSYRHKSDTVFPYLSLLCQLSLVPW